MPRRVKLSLPDAVSSDQTQRYRLFCVKFKKLNLIESYEGYIRRRCRGNGNISE